MIAVLAATALALPQQTQPAQAERDQFGPLPHVYRAAFEDRTSMVLYRAPNGLWFAFNPMTCTVQKVWKGEVEWRGKVFDFSQDNSRSKGDVLYELPSTLLKLEDGKLGEGWSAEGVEWKDGGWAFTGDGAQLMFDDFRFFNYNRVNVKFDEKSRKGPILVRYTTPGERELSFHSTMHGSSQTGWQWNFKQVPSGRGNVFRRLTFVQEKGEYEKSLRGIEVFGDKIGWYWKASMFTGNGLSPVKTQEDPLGAAGRIPETVWRGYEVEAGGKSLTLRFDVTAQQKTYHITHQIAPKGAGWSEQFEVSGDAPDSQVFYIYKVDASMPLKASKSAESFKEGEGPGLYPVAKAQPLTLVYGEAR